jgi:hypothetical protein
MNLDELQQRWAAQDERLDAVLRLNRQVLQDAGLGRLRSALLPRRAVLALEVAVLVAVLLGLGSFLARHLGEPRFFVPALALHVLAVVGLVANVRQWALLRGLDAGAPVLALQRRLERYRLARLRELKGVLLLSPLAWTLFLVVGPKAWLGVDAYATLGVRYLAANLLFSAAVIAAGVWASRRYAERLSRSAWMQGLARDVGGRSLQRAEEQLARLAAFERGEDVGR